MLVIASTAHSVQVTLAWDANGESDLAGYKVYYGTSSRNYTWFLDVGNVTSTTVANLSDGLTYYFAATAYDTAQPPLESTYSAEVSKSTCTYAIAPPSQNIVASGGTGSVGVTTQAGCPWTASSGAAWMTITSGSSGTGNGTVNYSVASNTSSTSRTTTSMIAGNVFTVTQAGTTTYTITASAGTGGTISPSGSVSVNYGANQAFSITANTGYQIASVTVDGVSQGAIASYTFTNVTANHTISASFSVRTYTITASAGTGGTISPSGTVSLTYGGGQPFTIAATGGYSISDVRIDGISQGAISSYTFNNVTSNHTISASFVMNIYTINATAGNGGSISPSGSVSVNGRANQLFTITASPGYRVADVLVDGVSTGAVSTYLFSTVTANHTISASFALGGYTLTITPAGTGTGTVTNNPSGSTFASGTVVTLNAATNASSTFTGWSGACSGSQATCTVTMNSNISVTATFTIKTYSIVTRASTGGSLSPTGTIPETYGASRTVSVIPSTGYRVKNVRIDGASVGAVTSVAFNNVTANHTVYADFEYSGSNPGRKRKQTMSPPSTPPSGTNRAPGALANETHTVTAPQSPVRAIQQRMRMSPGTVLVIEDPDISAVLRDDTLAVN
jgi:hypothetical protein